MHLSWINSQYVPDDNFVAIFASPLPPWCVLFFLFFFVACMQIFYWSGKHNILALLWSFPFWVGLQIFIFQGCCHILTPIKWNAERQSLNFEKISIKVFTNRVNHTRKRWAVNTNSNCLLFELQGVSKKKRYFLGFHLISVLEVGFYFFHVKGAKDTFTKGKFTFLLFKGVGHRNP